MIIIESLRPEKLKAAFNFVTSSYKRTAAVMAVAGLVLAIPFTLSLVSQEQDTRSRAAGGAVAVNLSPINSNIEVGEQFEVNIMINGADNDISAVDLTFTYDPALLSLIGNGVNDTNSTNSLISSFSAILNNATSNSIRFVAVNPSNVTITGSSIYIGTLRFEAKAPGTATVGFSNIHINASGVAEALPIDTANTLPGTYTITAATISATPSPTGQICGQAQTWGRNTTTGACSLFSTTCLDAGFVADSTCPGPSPTAASSPAATMTPTPTPFDGTPTPTRVPTATIFPTATLAPNQTNIALNFKMVGIGIVSSFENNVLQNPQRNIQVLVINSQNNLAASTDGTATFNPQTGLFRGVISVGDNFPSGTYLIKVRTDNTLWRQVPGIQNITINSINETQIATLVSGDLNADNEINLLDYNAMLTCLLNSQCKNGTGVLDASIPTNTPVPTPIFTNRGRYDFNNDGIIDEIDLNILYSGFTKRQGD